jgi:GT2 family glycosyltransferase
MSLHISVIIITYKRLDILKEVYASVLISGSEMVREIIIVNDDHDCPAEDIALHLAINHTHTRVVNNKKKGAAAARNMGAELATGDLLLFLDDDILVNSNTLTRIQALHQKYDRMLSTPIWEYSPLMQDLLKKTAFGRYRLAYDYATIRGEAGREFKNEAKLYEVDTLASFCLSVKRRHYLELNGMDEKFLYAGCEDQDFASNAKKAGFDLLLDENSLVLHHELDRTERANWIKRQYNGVQGFVFLCQKFTERKATALWSENTPVQKADPLKLKIKKAQKFLIRQQLPLYFFNGLVNLSEKTGLPEKYLYKLYSAQAGVYINKGFTKSYKENAHSAHHG